jgi:hypothetical protein
VLLLAYHSMLEQLFLCFLASYLLIFVTGSQKPLHVDRSPAVIDRLTSSNRPPDGNRQASRNLLSCGNRSADINRPLTATTVFRILFRPFIFFGLNHPQPSPSL